MSGKTKFRKSRYVPLHSTTVAAFEQVRREPEIASVLPTIHFGVLPFRGRAPDTFSDGTITTSPRLSQQVGLRAPAAHYGLVHGFMTCGTDSPRAH